MFLFLFVLWVVFNGRIGIDVILLGLAVSGAIEWFAMRYCKWYVTKDWRWGKFLPAFGRYCVLLVKEIFAANWAVIKLILDPKLEEKIHPQMVRFPCDYKSDIMKALLANSITLTPGTITVRIRSDHFIIHALTPEMGENLEQSSFYQACNKLDEYTCKPEDLQEKEAS
jgi:multicomponent Na+:H+ antiporter subunit E